MTIPYSLIDSTGQLLAKKELLKNIILGRVNYSEVEKEISAQIENILDNGVEITHADSHQNIHLFLPILKTIIKVATKYKIRKIQGQSSICDWFIRKNKTKGLVKSLLSIACIHPSKCASGSWKARSACKISSYRAPHLFIFALVFHNKKLRFNWSSIGVYNSNSYVTAMDTLLLFGATLKFYPLSKRVINENRIGRIFLLLIIFALAIAIVGSNIISCFLRIFLLTLIILIAILSIWFFLLDDKDKRLVFSKG